MQWQHGKYEKLANGSLTLTPIKVDGRQLYSDPCQYKNAVYTRYNASEHFKVPFSHFHQTPATLLLTCNDSNTPSPSTRTARSNASTSTNKTAHPSCPCTSPCRPRKCYPRPPSIRSLPPHPRQAKSSVVRSQAHTTCFSSAATGARISGGGLACS
jgi:hypothetical protein